MSVKGWWIFLLAIALNAQSQPRPATADQVSEIEGQVKSLSVAQQRIEKEISAILDVLSGKKPPLDGVFIGLSGHPSLGSGDAKVIMVEFTDFQCPFCAEYARTTLPRIISEYVNTGKVRYVVRNFPLEESHPFARKAAETGLCAQQQGKFWALHDYFFAHQDRMGSDGVVDELDATDVDTARIRKCIETGAFGVNLEKDMAEGRELGIKGTPTFFLGYVDPSDPSRMRAVRSMVGGAPFREFQSAVEQVLKNSEENRSDR